MRRYDICLLLLLLLVTLPGCCCPALSAARDAAKRTQSMNNIAQLGIAIRNYRYRNDQWPEQIEDLNPFVAGILDELIINPVTLDDPGYEYVKPEEDQPTSETVWLYQLRDGVRDMQLEKGYADGSVR